MTSYQQWCNMKISSKNIFKNLTQESQRLVEKDRVLSLKEKKLFLSQPDQVESDIKIISKQFFDLGFAQGLQEGVKRYSELNPPNVEKREMGGPVVKGKPYLVGEDGPELFQPNVSGNIVPNENIASMDESINPQSINQSVSRNKTKVAIQPIIKKQIQTVAQPVPMASSSNTITNVQTISKSDLPVSIAKMLN